MNLSSVIARYDALVRSNDSPEFPAIRNVATCEDGIYGAWGEVLDMVDGELSPAQYDALHNLFLAYQGTLRAELAEAQPHIPPLDRLPQWHAQVRILRQALHNIHL